MTKTLPIQRIIAYATAMLTIIAGIVVCAMCWALISGDGLPTLFGKDYYFARYDLGDYHEYDLIEVHSQEYEVGDVVVFASGTGYAIGKVDQIIPVGEQVYYAVYVDAQSHSMRVINGVSLCGACDRAHSVGKLFGFLFEQRIAVVVVCSVSVVLIIAETLFEYLKAKSKAQKSQKDMTINERLRLLAKDASSDKGNGHKTDQIDS